MKSLCARVEEKQQQPLARQRREILAILGRDPLSEIAFEHWATILADEQETSSMIQTPPSSLFLEAKPVDTKATTDGTVESEKDRDRRLQWSSEHHLSMEPMRDNAVVDLDVIERETRALKQAVGASLQRSEPTNDKTPTSENWLEEECYQDEITRLGCVIGMLFDLLPAIRRLRRSYLRQMESEESEKTILSTEETNSVTPPADDLPATDDSSSASPLGLTFDQLLEHSLDLASSLETLLRNDETWARKNNQNVNIYSGILRKEVNRLEEFKKASVEKRNPADMQEVIGTIATLGKALNEAIKDIAAPEKPGLSQKTGTKYSLLDAKSATIDADETIRKVIENFAACNRIMWKQSAMVHA